MPDFAPNYTARMRVTYTVQSKTHSCTWRLPVDTVLADLAAAQSKFVEFLDALADKIYTDFAIVNWSYSLADSAFFLPHIGEAWTAGAVSVSGRPDSQAALALSFVGRSLGGQRASFFLYGVGVNPVTDPDSLDFRIHSAEDANISAACGILNESPPPLVGNDGNDVIWYEYANVKYNDYYVGRSRG